MKILITLAFIFLILLSTLHLTVAQNKKLVFDQPKIEHQNIKLQSKSYEKLVFDNAFYNNEVGKPDLPVFYYKFYVPKGKTVTDVTFTGIDTKELQLQADLIPAQQPTTTSQIRSDTIFDAPNPEIYEKNALYPDKQASIFRSDFVDGDLEVVTIAVYPVQYNPVQNKIRMALFGEISLSTTSKNKDYSNKFEGHSNEKEMVDLVKSMVENPEDINSDKRIAFVPTTVPVLKSAQTAWSVPFYEYVIVTSRALKPAFNQFITWEKRKGYNAGIVCIEDILADPAATGDNLSSPALNDDAGKLRQYLYAGYSNTSPKTKYVLLGGDYTVVPIRYGKGRYDSEWNDGTGKIPSDLYFSDFHTNWTAVSTTMTGTYYTGFDYGPEIYVGRLLCNSETDIQTWTTKVFCYEQNPGNGNYSYLSKALMTKADGLDTINFSILPSIFTTKKRMVELPTEGSATPTYPKGVDVISELNTNYGLYCVFNHGAPNAFAVATANINSGLPKYQVTSSDSYTSSNITPESGNGLDNLTNSNFPTITYSISCLTMPFDDFDFYGVNQKIPAGTRTIGTSYTVAYTGGGPAYLGNTRDGWNPTGKNMEKIFFDTISIFPQLGIAEAKSKIGFGSYGYAHWTCLTHNLIGCPEMPMWTATPTTFNNVSISENGTSVTVNSGGIVADKICVMSAVNDGYFQVQPGVSSYTFTNVSKPYYVTVTKSNYIPFLNSLTNIYVQNKTLSSAAYLKCQTVSAGYSVDATQTFGNVVIQDGANITFDATGDIILAGGFEVQLGATFEAK